MSEKHLYRSFIIVFIFLAVAMRLALLNHELPYYWLDEHNVVEPALAFLSGDWTPGWYKYGPLFSYLLAFIYKIWMWIAAVALGWTESDFFYAAFFEPTSFYVLARAFHSLIVVGIAGVSFLFARRNFDSPTSVAVLILGLSPFLDIPTDFTVRIDTLQGLFSLLSIFFAARFGKDRIESRPYIMSGIFAGLSLATKPIPGLTLLPALVFGHVLSVWSTPDLSLKKKIQFAIAQPKLWILACSIIFGHSLGNPYSVIQLKAFLLEQYKVIFSKGAQGGVFAGYDFSWLVSDWGWPMAIAVAVALITAWRRSDNASRILLVYIATFASAFLTFKTRRYWYNSIFPAVILLVAGFVSTTSQSIAKYMLNLRRTDSKNINDSYTRRLAFVIMVFLIIILALPPWWETGHHVWDIGSSSAPLLEKRADRKAQLWIESNLPVHSPILLIGWHAINLPGIVADTPQAQAVWGQYFMYGRKKNLSWAQAFSRAYKRLQQSGRPAYKLALIREHYSDAYDPAMNSLLREYLLDFARLNGFMYIVTASPFKYEGTWEEGPRVKLLTSFSSYYFSRHSRIRENEVKIFEVLS